MHKVATKGQRQYNNKSGLTCCVWWVRDLEEREIGVLGKEGVGCSVGSMSMLTIIKHITSIN